MGPKAAVQVRTERRQQAASAFECESAALVLITPVLYVVTGVVGLGCREGIGFDHPFLPGGESVKFKIMGVVVVLLLAAVVALGTGITVFVIGSTPLAAAKTGGVAFIGTAMLGMGVLGYLAPSA